MTPAAYVELYHDLVFDDPRTGQRTAAEVGGYGSGWGPEQGCNRKTQGPLCSIEFNQFYTPALRMLHHGNALTPCGNPFYFRQKPLGNVSPDEEFYVGALIRAFNGKGSPDEITDALRLALAIGRVGTTTDANGKPASNGRVGEYCGRFITLDCNGLSGNYYGIDPNTKVSDYAVPGRRRMDIRNIAQADALVTVAANGNHEHIAVVESCEVVSRKADGTGTVRLAIVEWGEAGDITTHRKKLAGPNGDGIVSVTRGARYGLAIVSGSSSRYFFAPPQTPTPRRWGLKNNPAL
jgi:hypothetical protein